MFGQGKQCISETDLTNKLLRHKHVFDTEWFKDDPDLKNLVPNYHQEPAAQQSKQRLQ